MESLSFEQIESIFREMKLGTEEERAHFIKMGQINLPSLPDETQVFIRLVSTTRSNQENSRAELERPA